MTAFLTCQSLPRNTTLVPLYLVWDLGRHRIVLGRVKVDLIDMTCSCTIETWDYISLANDEWWSFLFVTTGTTNSPVRFHKADRVNFNVMSTIFSSIRRLTRESSFCMYSFCQQQNNIYNFFLWKKEAENSLPLLPSWMSTHEESLCASFSD